jgi:hypothetical protein
MVLLPQLLCFHYISHVYVTIVGWHPAICFTNAEKQNKFSKILHLRWFLAFSLENRFQVDIVLK